MGLTIGTSFVLAFLSVGLLYFVFPKVIKHWIFWYVFSMAVFVLSAGGLVYNIMHQPPPYGQNRERQIEYFSSDSRGQYYYEGYIGSFLYAAVGVALVLFFEFGNRNITTLAITAACLFAALMFFDNVLHIKMSWINITFNPLKAFANAIADLMKSFL